MSNIHVLERTNGLYRIVFHIAVPAGNNSAGLAWQSVILMSGLSAGTTALKDGDGTGTDGGISTAEKASIAAGSVYEIVDQVDTLGLSGAALLTFIDTRFTARQTEVQAVLQARLAQFGRVH